MPLVPDRSPGCGAGDQPERNNTVSRRTDGDAYAALRAQNAPIAMTDFMLKATLQYGLNTSVVEAMTYAGNTMGVVNEATKYAVEANSSDRLKRLAEAALGLENKRPRAMAPPITIESARVQSMLKATGRRKGDDVHVPNSAKATVSDYCSMVEAIGRSITGSPMTQQCLRQAAVTAQKQHRKSPINCFGSAVCVLRSTPHTLPSSVFVLGQQEKDDGTVSFNRVLPSGEFEPSTPGAIMDTPVSSVFLLKVQQNGAMRVTSTLVH